MQQIKYTAINPTTARVGDGSENTPNAVSSSFTGEVNILPKVSIGGKTLTVVEIGRNAFARASGVTNIKIPLTVTILKFQCFRWALGIRHLYLPSSITAAESCCMYDLNPGTKITFYGTKEPRMIYIKVNIYISGCVTDNIIVPLNYEKSTFLLKPTTPRDIKEEIPQKATVKLPRFYFNYNLRHLVISLFFICSISTFGG